jgi:NADPH2:quinone reductase
MNITGLNFIDTYYRTGLYKQDLPFIAGQEGAGMVVKLHPSVSEDIIQVGDMVVYNALGTYCEYTKVHVTKAVKIPSKVSIEAALCCMVQGLTAHYLVTDATASLTKVGDWVLIYSVGSGTCQWAAQLAKLKGYKVIGTTSRNKLCDVIQSSCDHLIVLDTEEGQSYANYHSVDIHAKVMEYTNGVGCACIIDGVGKSTADISVQCLALRGLWISFGNASGAVPPFSLLRLTPKSGYVTRPKLGDYVATKEELDRRCREVFAYVASGDLTVKVDLTLPLEDAKKGHAYLEGGQSKGKVLFKI